MTSPPPYNAFMPSPQNCFGTFGINAFNAQINDTTMQSPFSETIITRVVQQALDNGLEKLRQQLETMLDDKTGFIQTNTKSHIDQVIAEGLRKINEIQQQQTQKIQADVQSMAETFRRVVGDQSQEIKTAISEGTTLLGTALEVNFAAATSEQPTQERGPIAQQQPPQSFLSNALKRDANRQLHLAGFFASLPTKRLYQILKRYGEVVSLVRMGRGWAVAAFATADSANRALELNGHWAKSPTRPGIRVTPWNKSRTFPQDRDGEQFIGSDEHRRMKSSADLPNHGRRTVSARNDEKRTAPVEQATESSAASARPLNPEPHGSASAPAPARRPIAERLGDAPAQAPVRLPVADRLRLAPASAPATSKGKKGDNKVSGKENVGNVRRGKDAERVAAKTGVISPPGSNMNEQGCNAQEHCEPQEQTANQHQDRSASDLLSETDSSSLLNELDATRSSPPAGKGGGYTDSPVTRRRSNSNRTQLPLSEQGRVQEEFDFDGKIYKVGPKKVAKQLSSTHELVRVAGDGHCQPASIAATGQTPFNTYQDLKKAALSKLSNSKQAVMECLCNNQLEKVVQRPLEHMRKHLEATKGPAIEGDDLTLALYSFTCSCNIKVYDANTGNVYTEIKQISSLNCPTLELVYAGPGTPIYDVQFYELSRRTGGHYDALRPRPAPGNGQMSEGVRH
jgi:hypothetical protein